MEMGQMRRMAGWAPVLGDFCYNLAVGRYDLPVTCLGLVVAMLRAVADADLCPPFC
jgi:hypothetical protein